MTSAPRRAADGIRPDFYRGDEVYGNCPELRTHFEAGDQAYVLRVQKNFRSTLPSSTVTSCEQATKTLLKRKRRWEIRSAGKGSKGDRWYAWAWIATASPRHYLLIRKHLHTDELAFHYCFVPEGQLPTKARLIRAAGLRWPVEEGFEFGKDCFGLGQIPGQTLHRDRSAHRARLRRPRGRRRHRRVAARPPAGPRFENPPT